MSEQQPTAPHFSPDHNWWWTGTDWVSVAPPKKPSRWWVWLVIGGVIAAVIFGGSHASTPTVSNARIDSATQVEFDYHAEQSCNDLTYTYTFYDAQGGVIDRQDGTEHWIESAGQTYHVTATGAVDPNATRFDVGATCHS